MAHAPKTPTLAEFKRLSLDLVPLVRAVLMAQAFAELERERVDAYVRPIFDRYGFTVAEKWRERGRPERIEKPADLYLCDDEPGLKAFYADCDDAHRAHGFKGPAGHCPALTAEHLLTIAERALLDLAAPMFGIDPDYLVGDHREKFLKLIQGAAVQAATEAGIEMNALRDEGRRR
jgi:hypothetical protein